MKFPWKQGILKVPPSVRAKLDEIDAELILVAATKKVPLADISIGLYAHLGLTVENDRAMAAKPSKPDEIIGKWSRRNAEGWEIKRTDLPMITKTFVWETPNFGDGGRYGEGERLPRQGVDMGGDRVFHLCVGVDAGIPQFNDLIS